MKKLVLFLMVLALAVAGTTYAQAKPDYSGKWAVDAAKSDQGGGGRGPGGPMTIKQTATELTLTRESPMGEMTTTYKLDGSQTDVTMGQMQGKATAKIDGGKLVIKTLVEGPNGSMEMTGTYTLSADGKELTVVSVSSRGERKTVYTKQ